jgi:hypothetical protein
MRQLETAIFPSLVLLVPKLSFENFIGLHLTKLSLYGPYPYSTYNVFHGGSRKDITVSSIRRRCLYTFGARDGDIKMTILFIDFI